VSRFEGSRFRRVFLNDLQQQWRRLWIATLAIAGVLLVTYLTNIDPRAARQPDLYAGLFPAALLLGGLAFTSVIFADLHHPLQRFHYLMLPCSNLERFLGRYLLTGPLLYLYVLVVYAIVDWTGAAISGSLRGYSAAAFAPFEPRMVGVAGQYFLLHAVTILGAIFFRSYALAKTAVAAGAIGSAVVLAQLVAIRLLYFKDFSTLLPLESEMPVRLYVPPQSVMTTLAFLFGIWVLYVAYQCLREHEVQGEL
jgi:hypothetical protein